MSAANQAPDKPVDWALAYAKRGWHVLPLHSMRDGCCSCEKKDCASPAKHPHTRRGEKDASTDLNQIRAWWNRSPDANIGIATGPSKLVVLDVDGKKGIDLYQKLAADRTETLCAKTGRPDGFHLYYEGTGIPSSQVKGEHLDVRGTTGYVVAPGSVHANGTIYTFQNPNCAPNEWKKWIVWSDHQWQIDNDGAVIRLAKETVMAMYSEAIEIQDERRRQELIRHALKSQAEPRLQAMVSLAESESEVVLSPKKLDANPLLIGVKNGVVELKTGAFRPGRREDFITIPVSLSKSAPS